MLVLVDDKLPAERQVLAALVRAGARLKWEAARQERQGTVVALKAPRAAQVVPLEAR